MDNDIKIEETVISNANESSVHQQVAVLLEKELSLITRDENRNSFSILTEYPKTVANKVSFMWNHMWKRLIICFSVVLVITVILISFVQKANKSLVVQVNEFENLNLTSLLNKVSDIDQKIAEAESEKKELEAKRAAEIERIENNNSLALKQLSAMNIKNKKLREQKRLEIQETYNAELASLEKYNKLIATCNDNIKMYVSQRNEFDAGRVEQAEKQKAILNSERFLHEKEKQKLIEDYENRLEQGRNELKATLEADRQRQEKIVAETIEQYDPAVSREQKIQRLMKSPADSRTYNGAVINGNTLLLKDGVSDVFKRTLETQKSYYEDISYIASLYDQMPHRTNRAIVAYVNALRNWANTAGNEIAVSSVNEVNRVIAERNKIEYEKNLIIEAKERELELKAREIESIRKEKESGDKVLEDFLENLCIDPNGKNKIDGVVFRITSDVGYEIHIAKAGRGIFYAEEYRGFEFPCTVFRNGKKIANGNIELKENGGFVLVNISGGGNIVVLAGDRIVLGEPRKSS